MLTLVMIAEVGAIATVDGSSIYNEEPMATTVSCVGHGTATFQSGLMRTTVRPEATVSESSLETQVSLSSNIVATSDTHSWFRQTDYYDPACMADNYGGGGVTLQPSLWYAVPLYRTVLSVSGMWQSYETPQLYLSGMFFIGPVVTDSRLVMDFSVSWYGDWLAGEASKVRIRNNIDDSLLFESTYTHSDPSTLLRYEHRETTLLDIQTDVINELAIECFHDSATTKVCGDVLDTYIIFRAVT